MNTRELIAKLTAQRDGLSAIIAELEALDAEALGSVPVGELTPAQFSLLCSEVMRTGMKPAVVAITETAHKVLQSAEFEDEAARLSTGVRRSSIVGHLADEEYDN